MVSLFLCLVGWSAWAETRPPEFAKFVAWNMQNFVNVADPEAYVPKGGTKAKPSASVEATLRVLIDLKPDILGISEMGNEADLAALQSRLADGGLDLPHSEWVGAADDERHVALLSRYRILRRDSVAQLSYLMDGAQIPVHRGFLDVSIEVAPDWTLRCVGVHLKSQRDVPEGDQALMRRNEAHLLRRHVDRILLENPSERLVVYGDFNDSRESPAIRAVRGVQGSEAALNELRPVDANGERWTYYYDVEQSYSRIDYLFASRALMPHLVRDSASIYGSPGLDNASDHRPVSVNITAGITPKKKAKPRKPKGG